MATNASVKFNLCIRQLKPKPFSAFQSWPAFCLIKSPCTSPHLIQVVKESVSSVLRFLREHHTSRATPRQLKHIYCCKKWLKPQQGTSWMNICGVVLFVKVRSLAVAVNKCANLRLIYIFLKIEKVLWLLHFESDSMVQKLVMRNPVQWKFHTCLNMTGTNLRDSITATNESLLKNEVTQWWWYTAV